MTRESESRQRAIIALVTVQVLFGVHYGLALEIVAEIPPTAWALLRPAAAAVLLAAFVQFTSRSWPGSWREWRVLAGLSLFGVTFNQILFVEGLSRSTSLHGVLIMSMIPLLSLVLSTLAGHERLSAHKLGSVAVGGLGMVCLLRVDELLTSGGGDWLLRRDGTGAESFWDTVLAGDLMMLVNAFSFSLFLVLSKKPSRHFDPVTMTAGIFIVGTVGIAIGGVPALLQASLGDVSPWIWFLCIVTVIGPTVGTYALNIYAVKRVPASMVGLFIYLQFIVAATLGVTWRAETFDVRLGIAALLILGGLSLRVLRPAITHRNPDRRCPDPAPGAGTAPMASGRTRTDS